MALSSDPDAKTFESGDQATVDTPAMCPTRVSTCFPVEASQILMVPSAEAEAIHLPSGEMRTCEIGFWWPPSTSRGLKLGFMCCSGGGVEGPFWLGVSNGVGSTDTGSGERVTDRESDCDRDLDLDLDLYSERDLDLDGDLDPELDRERDRSRDVLRSL